MFSYKTFLSLSILLLVYSSVNCDDEGNRGRGRYKYNHPPAAEYDEPIPVAIVFDTVVDTSSQQKNSPKVTETTTVATKIEESNSTIDHNSSKVIETPAVATKIEESNSTTEEHRTESPKEELTTKTADTEDIAVKTVSKSKRVKSKFNVQELQIPVAVVYDEDPTIYNKLKSGERRRVRKQRRRPINPTTKSVTNVESVEAEAPKAVKVPEVMPVKETVIESTTLIPHQATTAKPQDEISVTAIASTQHNKRIRERDPVIPIVESENHVFSHSGHFVYSYESGDGTKAYSTGELKTVDKENNMTGEAVVGGFSYKDKDGMDISLSYTADENGYRPVGSHLPTPPPIPAAIARALAYLATKTTPEPVTEAIDST